MNRVVQAVKVFLPAMPPSIPISVLEVAVMVVEEVKAQVNRAAKEVTVVAPVNYL